MIFRVFYGIFAVMALVVWGLALFGHWEMDNRWLTVWVTLSLWLLYGHLAFHKD